LKKLFILLLVLIFDKVNADEIVIYYSTFTTAEENPSSQYPYCGTDPSTLNTQERFELTSESNCAGNYPWDAEYVGKFISGYSMHTREYLIYDNTCDELVYYTARYEHTFEKICKWECLYVPPADFVEVGLCSEKQEYIDAGVSPDDLQCGCHKESETDGSDQTILYKRDSNSTDCEEPDTTFPRIPNNYVKIFVWDENDADRSGECTSLKGLVQNAQKECIEKYRCIKSTDACPSERDEQISSYVSPRDGVFHEDIDIDGVDYTLHYQSADLAVGAVADGWSLSNHAVFKEQTVHMGGTERYLVDTIRTEGDNTVVPLGSIELVFDANNDHIATRDRYTKQTLYTFTYDADHRLVNVTDRFALSTQIIRDANGVAEQITAPHGQLTQLDVDKNNDLLSVTYEDGASYTFEYDQHLMTKEREPKGNTFLHIFDADGKIVRVVDAEAGEWNFAQVDEEDAGLNSVLRAAGDSVQYRNHYLNNGFLRSERIAPNGDTLVKESAVDDSETRLSSCGVNKTYTYKTQNGILLKDPVEEKRELERAAVTMPSGLSRVQHYDTDFVFADGSLISTTKNVTQNGAVTTVTRDYNTSTATTTSPEGRTSTVTFDKESLLPLTVQTGGLAPVNYLYDEQGRVIETAQGRRVTRFSYDSRGNMTQRYDVLRDTTTSYSYDERDRLTEVTYPDGHTTQFAYDANGNMSRLTTPTPSDHDFGYNGVNKRTSYTSPLGAATYYSYDKQRRVTQITRPSGNTVRNIYTYGQLTSVATPEGTTTYGYGCGNKPVSVSRGDERIDYAYDGDLLTAITQKGVLSQSIGYAYNSDFRVVSGTYAGKQENYAYDLDGLLVQSGDFTLVRDVNSSLVTEIAEADHKVKMGYNAYGEIKSLQSDAYGFQLRYDEGRIAHKTETLTRTVPNKKGKLQLHLRRPRQTDRCL